MSIRQKVEDHPVVFFLGTLVVGFVAGVGAYKSVLSMANLVSVPRYGFVTEQTLEAEYIPKDKHAKIVESLERQLKAAQSGRNGESSVSRVKYEKLASALDAERNQTQYLQYYAFSVTRLMRQPSSWSIPEIGFKVSLLNSVPSQDGMDNTAILGLTLPNETERNVSAKTGNKWKFSYKGTRFELKVIDSSVLAGGAILQLTKCDASSCQ